MKLWIALVLLGLPPLAWLAQHHGPVVQGALLTVNFLAVALYAHDKTAAQTGRLRTPELVLHALALLGGAPGAAWARNTFQHKTRKSYFDLPLLVGTAVLWACALV